MNRRHLLAALAGTTLLPSTSRAQQKVMPVIGFLHSAAAAGNGSARIDAFLEGLAGQGFEPNRSVAIEYRWAEGRYDRAPALATELLALGPAMMVGYGPPGFLRATIDTIPKTMPIVIGSGGDPVTMGLVTSLGRPDGNVTGVLHLASSLDAKRLELLRDLLPEISVIALLLNPKNSSAPQVREAAEAGARTLGRRLILVGLSAPSELDGAFATIAEQGAGALLVGSDASFGPLQDQIVALAAHYRLPAIYNNRTYTEMGGLLSYGASFTETYRLMGEYAGKVLHGVRPADLPVQQPTKFELVINLKTAKELDLAVPQSILARADEVIE